MVTDGYRKGSLLSRLAKWVLGWALILGAIVAFCLHGFSAFGLRFDPFNRLEHRAAAAETRADTNHALAAVATGQADAGIAALQAYDASQARARKTDATHQENSHALLALPGAQGALDPDLARTFHNGLCRYAAAGQDPGCAGLPPVPGSPPGQDAERAGPDRP